jgi:hypothetical protein
MPSERQSVATSILFSNGSVASTRTRRSSGVKRPVTTATSCLGQALFKTSPNASAVAMNRQKITGLTLSFRSGFKRLSNALIFGSSSRRASSLPAVWINASSAVRSSLPSIAVAGSISPSSRKPSSSSNTMGSIDSSSAKPPKRLRKALAAAAAEEPTQRMSAKVPQKARRR